MGTLGDSPTTSARSFVLIAPPGAALRSFSGEITPSDKLYGHFITELQRLRGRIYVEDGAVDTSDLEADGRHVSSLDVKSWHLLTVGRDGSVLGCTRFRQHSPSV